MICFKYLWWILVICTEYLRLHGKTETDRKQITRPPVNSEKISTFQIKEETLKSSSSSEKDSGKMRKVSSNATTFDTLNIFQKPKFWPEKAFLRKITIRDELNGNTGKDVRNKTDFHLIEQLATFILNKPECRVIDFPSIRKKWAANNRYQI